MIRLLHLSDLHFGTEYEPAVQALMRLVDDVQPNLVLLSGDITQRARRSQFAAARRFVQALQRPVLAVPGNHDIPLFNVLARMMSPYGGYRRALGPVLEPVIDIPGLLAIGVNSTRPARHERGEVSAAQAERVARRLSQARADCLRVVVLHHPVRAVVDSDRKNLLIGRHVAVPAWVEAGVDLILAGHIHLPYVLPVSGGEDAGGEADAAGLTLWEQGASVQGTPETMQTQARQAWVVQAGTAVSRRMRGGAPNSVYVIEHGVEEGLHQCAIERWDFAAGAQAFACESRLVLNWCRP